MRSAFGAFNEAFNDGGGGFDSFKFKQFASADLEYVEDPKWPGADSYRGESGFQKAMANQFEALGAGTVEPEEIIEVDGDRVLSIALWRGRGTSSGATAELRVAHLHTIEKGRIVRIAIYLDPAEGRRAAGI